MDATLTATATRTRRTPRPAQTGAAPAASPESIAPELRAFVVPIASLTSHPRNPRRGNLEVITESLRRFGQLRPIVVQRSSGYVVAGNHLRRAAVALGWRNLAATVLDLDDATASAYLLADNRSSDLGTYDDALLAALLEEAAAAGNLAGIGYGRDDIDELVARVLAEAERIGDPDAIPDAPADEEVYVRPGELWRLGRHVILSGDAVNPADVARLLAGATPTLLATDPPYGVSLDGSWRDGVYNGMGPAEQPYMQIEGGPDGNDATRAPAQRRGRTAGHRNTSISGDTRADWSEAFALVPSLEVAYVWCATTGMIEVGQGLERIGFELRQQIIWAKTQAAMSRSAYNWQHEPCWYAVRKGKTASWRGSHSDTTLWEMASPKMIMGGSTEQKYDHPTQKPVEAMSRAIGHHAGDVYEPFSGSGTTLIAAEQLGRRCYAMEIEPKFVQLTIERWQSHTGQRAVLEPGA